MAQVFSCEFCLISKNTFFHRTPLMAASERFIWEYISVKHIPDFNSLQFSQKTQFQNTLTYQNLFRLNIFAIYFQLKLILFTVHIFSITTFSLYQNESFALWKELMFIISIINTSLNIDWLASFSSWKHLIGSFEFNKKTPWKSLLLKLFLTSACY